MRVGIDGHIRGEAIHIEWVRGAVWGDLELVERARRMYRERHGHPIDESDPAAFISALEHAAPESLHIEIFADPAHEIAVAEG